ncbi:MAG: hypothetical protein H0U53_05855 [Actinobacteria bacterium]|nr:hypothetical protein [Actinomycetota bacterium]
MRGDPRLAPLLGAALAVLTAGSLIAASVIGASGGSRSGHPLEAFSEHDDGRSVVLPKIGDRPASSEESAGSPAELAEETLADVAAQLGAPVTTDTDLGAAANLDLSLPDANLGAGLSGPDPLLQLRNLTGGLGTLVGTSQEVLLATSDATKGSPTDLGLSSPSIFQSLATAAQDGPGSTGASKKDEKIRARAKKAPHGKDNGHKGDASAGKSKSNGKSKSQSDGVSKPAPSKRKPGAKTSGKSKGTPKSGSAGGKSRAARSKSGSGKGKK